MVGRSGGGVCALETGGQEGCHFGGYCGSGGQLSWSRDCAKPEDVLTLDNHRAMSAHQNKNEQRTMSLTLDISPLLIS